MEHNKLDDLLMELRRNSVAELSASFATDVLREIRTRKPELRSSEPSDWFSKLSYLLRPSLLASALIVAVSVGVALPAVGAARSANESMAVAGLGMNVFSPSSPVLPSGLLGKFK